MLRKLSLGFVVSLGLVLLAGTTAPEAAQGQQRGDCCKQRLACCKGDRDNNACCVATGDEKLGCCSKGQRCCTDNRGCCSAPQRCCQSGDKCCDEGNRACCGKK
jgi:hypothetical protein